MIDGHHPNQKGYFIIGSMIAQKIRSIFHLDSKRLKELDSEEGKGMFNISDEKLFYIYIYTARWFYRMSTWRHDPTERLNEAEKLFVKALELNQERHEPYTGLAMVHLLRNDMDEAKSYLSKAKMIDAESLDAYLNLPWIRTIIKNAEIH
jgi:tetratricopeptide (TPR) repeat protein